MRKYIMAHPAIFVTTVLLGILTQGTATAISLFLMFVIDSITMGDMHGLVTSAYLSVGVILLFFLSLLAYTRFTVLYSYKTVFKLKNDIFSAIMGTGISEFNQSNSAKHISVLNNDVQMVNEKYISSILAMTKDITTMVFALGAMAFLSPVNALIALVLSSSPLIVPAIFGGKLSKTNMTYMKKMGALNEKVKDYLSGFEVIKSFGIEKNIRAMFSKSSAESELSRYEAGKVNVKVGTFAGTILIATQIITYLVAGYFVITGSITIGAVIAIAGLSGSIMQPIQFVSINLANIKSTKEVRENLLEIMQPKDVEVRDKDANFDEGIVLENLSFKYDPPPKKATIKASKPTVKMIPMDGRSVEETLKSAGISGEAKVINTMDSIPFTDSGEIDVAAILAANGITDVDLSKVQVFNTLEGAVLKNISYKFKPGGKYAIVGSSGSGKSTLLKVLTGYYDNYLGKALVGGNEIKDINREKFYGSLSIIHQNVFMLDDTLRNNITLGNDYSDEEYARAVESAQLGDVVKAADSKVGEGGNTLSGGERQRVAIARALIKGCKVMVIDEAMSNLDNETAYNIERTLVENPNMMCIFVTHRYTKELLHQCDGILVMNNGELVEHGTFDELYEKKDYFYSLYNLGRR